MSFYALYFVSKYSSIGLIKMYALLYKNKTLKLPIELNRGLFPRDHSILSPSILGPLKEEMRLIGLLIFLVDFHRE